MAYSESALASFRECPLQYFYKHELGLRKIEEGTTEHHLVYGRAMHEGLKHLYLKDTLASAIQGFKDAYPTQLDPEDLAKTQANGVLTLEAYAKHWGSVDAKWKVLSVEEKNIFSYVDNGFTVVLDLVMENTEHGGIYGWDHKVVGGRKAYLGYEFWNQFEPNSQINKYYSYVKSKYGECSGFYVNAIGMWNRSRAYKGEPAGFHWKFERQMFNRNEDQLERERRDTQWWIDQIEASKKLGVWAMNTASCHWCSYRPICMAGWEWERDRELIMLQYKSARLEGETKEDSNAISGRTAQSPA